MSFPAGLHAPTSFCDVVATQQAVSAVSQGDSEGPALMTGVQRSPQNSIRRGHGPTPGVCNLLIFSWMLEEIKAHGGY